MPTAARKARLKDAKDGAAGLADADLARMLLEHAEGIESEGRSYAPALMREAVRRLEVFRDALQAAEKADRKANNCTEHEPSDAPESCEKCFPSADDARTKRWAALGLNKPKVKHEP